MPFLVFEGLDGSGKSTLMSSLSDHLEGLSQSVQKTREPGGTPLAEDIRDIILRKGKEIPVPLAELFLYEASRAQHVANKIQPSLQKGEWVLCDRFTASSEAFQAAGRELSVETVRELNRIAAQGIEPDLWILLDLPVAEGQKRIDSRQNQGRNRLDAEKQEFHERVRAHYLQMAKQSPRNWLTLDATQSRESLLNQLVEELELRKWL